MHRNRLYINSFLEKFSFDAIAKVHQWPEIIFYHLLQITVRQRRGQYGENMSKYQRIQFGWPEKQKKFQVEGAVRKIDIHVCQGHTILNGRHTRHTPIRTYRRRSIYSVPVSRSMSHNIFALFSPPVRWYTMPN